jgi:hypothetical protein
MNDIKNPKFFEGGRAVFTVANGKGEHYTYRIGRSKPEQPLFVGLLTGPNNEADYTYMGIYAPETGSVRLTAKSKFTPDTKPVKVIQWAVKVIREGKPLPEGYSVQHEGRCCRCGRTLTDPLSIERGIGPECWEKTGGW